MVYLETENFNVQRFGIGLLTLVVIINRYYTSFTVADAITYVYICFNLNNLSTYTFVAPGQNVNSNSYIKYNNYSNIFVVVILKQNKMLLHLSSNKRETQST